MKPLSECHAVVTGAGGFIGSHLTETLLPLCAKVTALLHYDSRPDWGNLEFLSPSQRNSLEMQSGDVTDAHWIRRMVHGKDIVFHLAALIAIPYSYTAPSAFLRNNALGTLNVLEACREEGVFRVICTSTSECYGTARTVPIDENHPLQAQSPYAASKIAADKIAESYFCSFNTPVVVVRPFNTYGPRQSGRAVIPTIISQVLGDTPVLRLGALDPIRDLTYVSDTVSGFLAAATAKGIEGEVLNLGVGEGITIGELAQKIMVLAGIQKEIVCGEERLRPDRSEVMRLISDNRKAAQIMNWRPEIPLDEGLQCTIEFVRAHPGFYKTGKYVL